MFSYGVFNHPCVTPFPVNPFLPIKASPPHFSLFPLQHPYNILSLGPLLLQGSVRPFCACCYSALQQIKGARDICLYGFRSHGSLCFLVLSIYLRVSWLIFLSLQLNQYFTVHVYHIFIIQSSVERHLGCFSFLAIGNELATHRNEPRSLQQDVREWQSWVGQEVYLELFENFPQVSTIAAVV